MVCLYSPVEPSAVHAASGPTSEGQQVKAMNERAAVGAANEGGQRESWGKPSQQQAQAAMGTPSPSPPTTGAGAIDSLNHGNGKPMLNDEGRGNEGNLQGQTPPRAGGNAHAGTHRWPAIRSSRQQHGGLNPPMEWTRAQPPTSQNGSVQALSGGNDSDDAVNRTTRWEEGGTGMTVAAPQTEEGGGRGGKGPLQVRSSVMSKKKGSTTQGRKRVRVPVVTRISEGNIDDILTVHNKARY